jgi:hypothetical protein
MARSRYTRMERQPAPVQLERAPDAVEKERPIPQQRGEAASFASGRIDPRRLTRQGILSLQRTAGNRAVNALLHTHTLLPLQRDPTPKAPAAGQDTKPASVPQPGHTAASLWHDAVVEPLTQAGAAWKQGPKHVKECLAHVEETLQPIHMVQVDFANSASAWERLGLFQDRVLLVQTDLNTADSGTASFNHLDISDRCSEAQQVAAAIGPTLDAQSGGKAPQSTVARDLWGLEVLDPLTEMQSSFNFNDADPMTKGLLPIYSEKYLPQLEKMRKVVNDVYSASNGDVRSLIRVSSLVLKIDRLIAMVGAELKKKVDGGDITRRLEAASFAATDIELQIDAGTLTK